MRSKRSKSSGRGTGLLLSSRTMINNFHLVPNGRQIFFSATNIFMSSRLSVSCAWSDIFVYTGISYDTDLEVLQWSSSTTIYNLDKVHGKCHIAVASWFWIKLSAASLPELTYPQHHIGHDGKNEVLRGNHHNHPACMYGHANNHWSHSRPKSHLWLWPQPSACSLVLTTIVGLHCHALPEHTFVRSTGKVCFSDEASFPYVTYLFVIIFIYFIGLCTTNYELWSDIIDSTH